MLGGVARLNSVEKLVMEKQISAMGKVQRDRHKELPVNQQAAVSC